MSVQLLTIPIRSCVMLALAWAMPAAACGDSQPTFSRDIAPIIFANCSECHRPGQAAPFSLLTYEDAHKRAKQIAQVTHSRFMPPWLPQPSEGRAGVMNERRLTAEQIDLIQQWENGGAVEGDPKDLPQLPQFKNGWRLGEPDLILTLPEPYTLPAESTDTIRTFVFPISLPHAGLIKAIDLQPGNFQAVHHASLLIDTTGSARLLDSDDPRPGYRGMGDIGLNLAGSFGAWSAGGGMAMLPEGIGRPIPQECDLSVEFHFNPTGKPETIQPRVGLYFLRGEIDHRVASLSLGAFILDIAAGEKQYIVSDSMTLPVASKLIGLTPHAHYLCRRIKIDATLPDGCSIPLLRIDDWDFNWQQEYRLATPLDLPAGTKLQMQFEYDNSMDNPRNPNNPPKRVRAGGTAADEMALVFFTVVAVNERERTHLENAHQEKLLERMKQAQLQRAAQN